MAAPLHIAPTQDVLAVVQQGEKRLGGPLRWGLIPYWAKDLSTGGKNINARAEMAGEKPFREEYRGFTLAELGELNALAATQSFLPEPERSSVAAAIRDAWG